MFGAPPGRRLNSGMMSHLAHKAVSLQLLVDMHLVDGSVVTSRIRSVDTDDSLVHPDKLLRERGSSLILVLENGDRVELNRIVKFGRPAGT
jgi:hypothetical protein